MNRLGISQAVQIDVLAKSGGVAWDKLVLSHPGCTFFHSAAWARVICQTYGHRPCYLYFPDPEKEGQPATLVPLIEILSRFTGRRAVCLPFSDFCGPLVFSQNGLSLVGDELSKLARERAWKYFEIRSADGLEKSAEAAVTFYGHKLSLCGEADKVFARFGSSTKGAIRQGLASDLNVQVMGTSEAVTEFYQLHVRTRRRHGVPPQPLSFFMNIHENALKAGLGFVVLARSGLRAVAGAIFLRFGHQAIYKFAASDPRFARSRGNNLVLWRAIKDLVDQGTDMLHFGRTPLDNDGLRKFKLSWGAEEEMIRYYRRDAQNDRWMTAPGQGSNFPNRVFRRLPLGLNRIAGAALYPHLD
jgi:hypothetical protein